MGRKTLLAAALAAALAGLVACGSAKTYEAAGPVSVPRPGASTPSAQQAKATASLPAGIRVVRITLVPGMNDKAKPPGPVTVTGQATVASLVALVNGLPPFPPGNFSCPMSDGRGVRLTFLPTPTGTPLATAFAAGNGCGGATLTVGSTKSVLGPQNNDPAQRALAIAGITWSAWGPA